MDRTVDGVTKVSALLTGLQTSALLDRHSGPGRKEEFEFLQLASYTTGGYYDLHQDPLYVYKATDTNITCHYAEKCC